MILGVFDINEEKNEEKMNKIIEIFSDSEEKK